MALAETKQIDLIGISKNDGTCVLTIVDNAAWDEPGQHLRLLQEKLNSYFAFIESGELLASYPKAENRQVSIDVLYIFPIPQIGLDFLRIAAAQTSKAGFKLTWNPLPTES